MRHPVGLARSTGSLVDQLWPVVLTDLGVDQQSDATAWGRLVVFDIEALEDGERTVVEAMREVVRAYVATGYPTSPSKAALIDGLDDELAGRCGRESAEIETEAAQILARWADGSASP